jgi:hypothetical protein
MEVLKKLYTQLSKQSGHVKTLRLANGRLVQMLLFLTMLTFTGCEPDQLDRNSSSEEVPTERIDKPEATSKNSTKDLLAKIETLEGEVNSLKTTVETLQERVDKNSRGSGSRDFIFWMLLLITGVYAMYHFRHRVLRMLQGTTDSGNDHSTRSTFTEQANDIPTSAQRDTPTREPNPPSPTPSKTNIAPAAAPPDNLDLDQSKNSKVSESTAGPRQVDSSTVTPVTDNICFAHGPSEGTFTPFGREDFDEYTAFKIMVDDNLQTATFVVANNGRQQRNIMENPAAFAGAVQYIGETSGNYTSAKIVPGTLRQEENKWRIVDRMTIENL